MKKDEGPKTNRLACGDLVGQSGRGGFGGLDDPLDDPSQKRIYTQDRHLVNVALGINLD